MDDRKAGYYKGPTRWIRVSVLAELIEKEKGRSFILISRCDLLCFWPRKLLPECSHARRPIEPILPARLSLDFPNDCRYNILVDVGSKMTLILNWTRDNRFFMLISVALVRSTSHISSNILQREIRKPKVGDTWRSHPVSSLLNCAKFYACVLCVRRELKICLVYYEREFLISI